METQQAAEKACRQARAGVIRWSGSSGGGIGDARPGRSYGGPVLLRERRRELRLGVPLALRGRAFPLGGAASLEGVLEIEGGLLWLVLSGTPYYRAA